MDDVLKIHPVGICHENSIAHSDMPSEPRHGTVRTEQDGTLLSVMTNQMNNTMDSIEMQSNDNSHLLSNSELLYLIFKSTFFVLSQHKMCGPVMSDYHNKRASTLEISGWRKSTAISVSHIGFPWQFNVGDRCGYIIFCELLQKQHWKSMNFISEQSVWWHFRIQSKLCASWSSKGVCYVDHTNW